jgi:Protein of unknown function (DUF3224)
MKHRIDTDAADVNGWSPPIGRIRENPWLILRRCRSKGNFMTTYAGGTFEVKLTPQDDKSADATLGRMTIDKQFHGDLEAVSNGQMLTAGTAVIGSAGYVAIERVSGKLHGLNGSFTLQHSATMTRGEPQLTITVVPDSGTGQLEGLAGKMTIKIADGKHSYSFEYTLAETP